MIEGENLVVHRTPNGGHVGGEGEMGKGGGREEAALYQNLDFMSKRGSDSITTANVYMEDTDRSVNIAAGYLGFSLLHVVLEIYKLDVLQFCQM